MKHIFEESDVKPGTVVRLGEKDYLIRETAYPTTCSRYELVREDDHDMLVAHAAHIKRIVDYLNQLSFQPVSPVVQEQNTRLSSSERIKFMGLLCTLDEALEWYRGYAVLADPEPDWVKTARDRVRDLVERDLMV